MRAQALAKQEVGDFLTEHFVSVYDKVGSFLINVGSDGRAMRMGGNVAAFFCTPNGNVIHVAAGPRTGEAFVAEAKWALAMYSEITADNGFGKSPARVAIMLRQAHAEALDMLNNPDSTAPGRELVWSDPPSNPKLAGLDEMGRRQRKMVHQLLVKRALDPIGSVGPLIYMAVLGEKVTSRPVHVNGTVDAKQGARTGQSLLEFYTEGGASGVSQPPPDDSLQPIPPPAKTAKMPTRSNRK